MQKSLLLLLFIAFSMTAQTPEKLKINQTLDAWHKAASDVNFEAYFGYMSPNAIYIGTDATENWDVPAFKKFAKPYFDKGKAWSFTALERNIYFDKTGNLAWFDELLNTQMKICRGSGVLIKVGSEWKIQHYVLSMTIPNANTNVVVPIKAPIEDNLIQQLQKK